MGLLSNKVPWHLYQWIIIKDLKIPISKMSIKLVLWDNFTSIPEIIHFILINHDNSFVLFSSDNSFVLCHDGKLIFIVTIFNPSDCPPIGLLWPHYRRAMFQELKTTLLHEESVTWNIMNSVKAKIWKLLLTSKCCGSSCKKFDSGFQFQFQSF